MLKAKAVAELVSGFSILLHNVQDFKTPVFAKDTVKSTPASRNTQKLNGGVKSSPMLCSMLPGSRRKRFPSTASFSYDGVLSKSWQDRLQLRETR